MRAHGAGRSRVVVATVALTIACAAIGALWSIMTPAFSTTDERNHINSVVRLMQGGGWPDAHTSPLLEAVAVAAAESGHPFGGDEAPDPLPAPADRTVIVPLDEPIAGTVDNMTQHPPGYYGIVAGVLTALGGAEWRWDELILGMRLLSVLIASAAVPCIVAAVHMAVGSRAAAIAGGAVVLASPQLYHVLGLVTNDALAITIGCAILALLVRAWTRPERLVSTTVALGVVLGAGLLTKGLLLAAIPVVLGVLLLVAIRTRTGIAGRVWPWLGAGGIAFAIGGWWWLRNRIVYGTFQPSLAGDGREGEAFDGYSLVEFVRLWAERLNATFWGSTRDELAMPAALTVTLSVVALVTVVAAIVCTRQRAIVALLAIYPVLVAGLFTFHAWEIYWDEGRIAGVQGRYVLSALTVLAVAGAALLTRVAARMPRAVRMLTPILVMLACAAIAAYGLRFAFRVQWSSGGGLGADLEAMAAGWPISTSVLIGLGVVAAIGLVVAALLAASMAGARRADGARLAAFVAR